MTIYNFIPIENEGMSVITLLVLAFAGMGSLAILRWLIQRLDDHDTSFKAVAIELSNGRVQFAELKGSIRETKMIVDRIDASLSDIARTNTKVIESYLNNDRLR